MYSDLNRRLKMNAGRVVLTLLVFMSQACAAIDAKSGSDKKPSFSIQKDSAGKYWFADAEGNQFLSLGINNVIAVPFRPKPGTDYYNPVAGQFEGDYGAWKQDVFRILGEHGFNTIGAWSDGELLDGPLFGTICLYVAGYAQERCLDGLRPGFEQRVREQADLMLRRYPHRETVLGVFLDNEMPWYGHGHWGEIPNYTLLETALSLPGDDAARQAALDFLKKRYPTLEAFCEAWGRPVSSWEQVTVDFARSCMSEQAMGDRQAFIALAAEAFYRTASRTVREMMPGVLILGTRFAGSAPRPVIEACGRYCDVISFNQYRAEPAADSELLTRLWIWGGQKPLMVTEYSWRAEENSSGNPNTGGAGAVVKTQAERAENYQKYVEDLLAYPMVIGAHWFEFADQSPQGRFDGENSNYGIVDIHHRPYAELLSAMKATHQRIAGIHARSDREAPRLLPKPKAVVFEASQRPQRPPTMNLLSTEPAGEPELFHAPDASIALEPGTDCLEIKIQTGRDWGCGVLFFGPRAWAVKKGPAFATDLDGYTTVELDAEIPENVTFDLLLDEAGVDRPDAVSYDKRAGDDGEGFLFSSIRAVRERKIYRFDLKNLEPRTAWGNQKGARRVDIHAMKGIAFHFHGGQGEKTALIYSLKLVR